MIYLIPSGSQNQNEFNENNHYSTLYLSMILDISDILSYSFRNKILKYSKNFDVDYLTVVLVNISVHY